MFEEMHPSQIVFTSIFLLIALTGVTLLIAAPRMRPSKIQRVCRGIGDRSVWFGSITLIAGSVYLQWGRDAALPVGLALLAVRESALAWKAYRSCGRRMTPHAACSLVIAVGFGLLAYGTIVLGLSFFAGVILVVGGQVMRPFVSQTRELPLPKPTARSVSRIAIIVGLVPVVLVPFLSIAFYPPILGRSAEFLFLAGLIVLTGGLALSFFTRRRKSLQLPTSLELDPPRAEPDLHPSAITAPRAAPLPASSVVASRVTGRQG